MNGHDDTRDLGIGEAAALAHVTVGARHHYDRIGLLRPSARAAPRA